MQQLGVQQPYEQQPYAQQPFAQQPYGQHPYAPQPYGQQPYGAPPAAQPQAQAPQAYTQPSAQAAPVAPVSCPTYTPLGGQPGQAAQQQSPQQAFARHLTGVAKSLEQTIPSYQIMMSIVLDLTASPQAQGLAGVQPLLERLKEVAAIQGATLGAIRRFLCGEATQDVLLGLSVGVQQTAALHGSLKPLLERMLMGARPELRQIVTGLAHMVTTADPHLAQAATAVQQAVPAPLWEAATTRVQAMAANSSGSRELA